MKCDRKIVNRISRLNGQMAGVLKMMETERGCEEIVMQLSAIRSSIDKTIALITVQNLIEGIESKHEITVEDIEQELNLLIKNR